MRGLYFIISSGALILLVLFLRSLCGKVLSPGVRYALWLIPALRLCIPFGFVELPAFGSVSEFLSAPYEAVSTQAEELKGLAQALFSAAEAESEEDAPSSDTAVQEQTQTVSGVPAAAAGGETLPQAASASAEATKPASEHAASGQGSVPLPALIWLGGSFILLLGAVVSNRKLLRSVRRMEETVEDCPLPVYVSDGVVTPCLFGFLHPCILLNRETLDDPALLRDVLRHELAHYAQKDHLWTALRIALCVVYWWHPLVWLGVVCAREDAELSCDARAIRGLTDQERRSYGYSLLKLLTHAGARGNSLYAATSMSGGKKSIRRRMEGIARRTPGKRGVSVAVLLLLLAAAVGGCAVPASGSYLRRSGEATDVTGVGGPYADYEFSVQDEIKSRVFYYEIWTYGERSVQKRISLGEFEDSGNQLHLRMETGDGSCDIMEEDDGTTLQLYLGDAGGTAWGGSALGEDGEKRKLESGDDLVLLARYEQGDAESLSVYTCEALTEATQEELSEMLKDTPRTALLRMILSDQSAEELSAADGLLPGGTADEGQAADVEAWAEAFVSRDADTLLTLMTEETAADLEERGLLVRGENYASFGYSSPWPLSAEGEDGAYRVVRADGEQAEIIYYAWDSTPHLTVWRETLTFSEDTALVTGETLTEYGAITTAAEYEEAYPDGITSTPMNYLTNGLGAALNENAKTSENEYYQSLFMPETAACALLNLDMTDIVREDTEGLANIRVTFLEDGSTLDLTMVHPDLDGIWIPEDSGFTPEESLELSDTTDGADF